MALQFTLFESTDILTKRVSKALDGTIKKTHPSFYQGTAHRVDVADAHEFAALLERLDNHSALAYGVTERLRVPVGVKDKLKPGQIARSREHFTWSSGAGILFLDFDGKHTADDIPTLRRHLADAMPEIDKAPQVWTHSSSAGIHDTETGETTKGGLHCYVLIKHGKTAPVIGKQLYDALWAEGHGHHILNASKDNPAALERCLIDASVWQPERLDYAAAPVVYPPLTRSVPAVAAVINPDRPPLDAAKIAPLSDITQETANHRKVQSREQARGEVEVVRKEIITRLPAVERDKTRQRWLAADNMEITADTLLHMANGTTVTAGEVRAKPELYSGQRLADPLEPTYGHDSRIAMVTAAGNIFSHAHGGQLFRIVTHAPTALADCFSLPAQPDSRDVISACYKFRATAKGDGLENAAKETGATIDYTTEVWREHLSEHAKPLHAAMRTAEHFTSFETLADCIAITGESVFIQAELGSGKTRNAGGRLVADARKNGRPVLTVTGLTALTEQNATLFSAQDYRDDKEILSASDAVSTTVHSLHSDRLRGFINRLEHRQGLVVIDEAAAVAELLFTPGGILEDKQRHMILRRLESLAASGVQFAMLDGDATPTAAVLADMLGCRLFECDENEYPQPRAEIYPVQRVLEADTDKTITTTPCHAEIVRALGNGEKVVLATDSREQAERLHTMYAPMTSMGALCIHGQNADQPEQRGFIENPNEQAKRYQLVIYSPALSVGVSVTSVVANVFVVASSGTLDAAGLWQMARRYRCALGGVVRFIVEPHLCRPTCQRVGLRSIQADISQHALEMGMLHDAPELRGLIATTWQRNLYEANPLHALYGHLLNIGLNVATCYPPATDGREAKRQARETVRAVRIERVSKAEALDAMEGLNFEKTARSVQTDQDRLERHRIEAGLALAESDFTADGHLPAGIVEDALYDGLLTRVRRQAWLVARADGADLDDDDSLAPGYAFLKHRNRQADIMADILEALRDDDGQITVSADIARTVADTFRQRINIHYSDLNKPPHRKARAESVVRWMRDTLKGWGFEVVHSERVQTEGSRERIYTYTQEPKARAYAKRLASRLSGQFLPWDDECETERAETEIELKPAWLSRSSVAS